MKKLVFIGGAENKEFKDFEKELEKGERVSGEWRGDFFVSTIKLNGRTYEHSFDWDLGIPYSIEQIA